MSNPVGIYGTFAGIHSQMYPINEDLKIHSKIIEAVKPNGVRRCGSPFAKRPIAHARPRPSHWGLGRAPKDSMTRRMGDASLTHKVSTTDENTSARCAPVMQKWRVCLPLCTRRRRESSPAQSTHPSFPSFALSFSGV